MNQSSPPQPLLTRLRQDWAAVAMIWPYLARYRSRVIITLSMLFLARLANVSVPVLLKQIIDVMSTPAGLVGLPLVLLIGYALLRFSVTLLNELRDAYFARTSQGIVREVALRIFAHLHALSPRFHHSRATGGLSRDIERGTRGISWLLSFAIFNVLPNMVEVVLVFTILALNYEARFSLAVVLTLVLYIGFTVKFAERRMVNRRKMNDMDSRANSRAIDSLMNADTVKQFANAGYEIKRFDQSMRKWEQLAVNQQHSLSALNIGQSAIIALGVSLVMILAADGVMNKTLTLGDLVLVNAYILQLCMPLNFLGYVYNEIKQALADTENMLGLLAIDPEIKDASNAQDLIVSRGEVVFSNVQFGYNPGRMILNNVSLRLPAGQTVAVVGSSGAGKSTMSRLLLRFYDPQQGRLLIDGQDIAGVRQESLRRSIGVVPQDTALFNDTIYHNISYARPGASRSEVIAAARLAQIHDFIEQLPDSYETMVGERGLKLSGGEKQRIAIARAILKDPPIMIFDEATSALDTRSEAAIMSALVALSKNRTTLIIAHRLSTVVAADLIVVMEAGRVVEQGTHAELLAQDGIYTQLWMQQATAPEAASMDAA